MIREGDYVLVTDPEDKNYLKVGIVNEVKYDSEGMICTCGLGFEYDQKVGKKRYENYIGKGVHRKFKVLAFKE